jgi:hypothetical protein
MIQSLLTVRGSSGYYQRHGRFTEPGPQKHQVVPPPKNPLTPRSFFIFHHPSTNGIKATTFRFPFFLCIINNNHQSSSNPSIINSQSINQFNTPIQCYFNLPIHNTTLISLIRHAHQASSLKQSK